jgi:uncharacterized membrane protein (UPF0127 family)
VRTVHLYRNGEWIAGPLEMAETFFERSQGLLGRNGLDGLSGMVIEWCGTIHTCFMRFPIDVVFLTANGTVRKVCHDVKPFRIATAPFSRTTVELRSGAAREAGIEKGQIVEFRNLGPKGE